MENSYQVRTERCPICAKSGADRKGNNLAVYNDGHTYCFAGHGIVSHGDKYTYTKMRLSGGLETAEISSIVLPDDCDTAIPSIALSWLSQYELSLKDCIENSILWSDSLQRLIFPVYDDNHKLLIWLGRSFNKDVGKWYVKGPRKDLIYVKNKDNAKPLYLVEDIVSLIKLASLGVQVGCLFSSHTNKKFLQSLPNKEIIFWLDYDKARESIKLSREANVLGKRSSSIITKLDPKELLYNELRARL